MEQKADDMNENFPFFRVPLNGIRMNKQNESLISSLNIKAFTLNEFLTHKML